MAFQLRGIVNSGLGLSDIKFDGEVASPTDILAIQKDLGLVLLDKRTDATIKAYQDPARAAGEYREARAKIDKLTAQLYKTAGKQAADAGLATDVAMQYARKRAVAYHEAELELLNLTHPYAESAEGLVALASGVKRKDLLDKTK